ncbi:PREDICTED: uncharacterized protein LOC108763133 [Trachymyrmex cornetzi]|uniref:uncharacterized protein LOC108763133 n=1 Tax=Trachymyrmex cornetzi TaxID=471704 RepID=UPI00084F5B9B|nr:PREDICTED: uncharacterized protein LOC108763133 [Trachymyrmex cornetzi]
MQRQKNFSGADKESLLDLIFLQRDVIENKETDRSTLVKKDEVWVDITNKYNANTTIKRSEKALRYCWDNLKKAARKYCATLKRESYKTGGGIVNIPENLLLKRVNEIMGETAVYGLENPFDSDATNKENITIEPNIVEIDDDENDREVFTYLMKEKQINNWKSWDPQKLKSKLSSPLKDEDMQTSSSDNSYKKIKYSGQSSKKTLDEVKTELANTLKMNVEEKNEYEKQILEAKLEKEKLKIELLKIFIEKEKGTKETVEGKWGIFTL